MLEVLKSPGPPSVEFFRSLPRPADKVWGVYALLLEHPELPPSVYIGSGTNAKIGVFYRLRQYKTQHHRPRLVQAAVRKGYTITHYGLLC
ncbi:hypothetical protein F5Y05DRAFT_374715 [Hypoxylon sp. FL0543]|nr:hypothetical protein F5Y05DRAFT_374715 [Hypoxylon sp. FL0543]